MQVQTKSNLSEETIDKLQSLIEINIDSAKGFAEAAEKVSQDNLAKLFRTVARERQAHVDELQGYVAYNREEPNDEGSAAGALHRGWIDLRAAINGGDPTVILIEAERGEDKIKAKYEEVLEEARTTPIGDVLMKQYASVKRQHDLVRDMRDAFKEAD